MTLYLQGQGKSAARCVAGALLKIRVDSRLNGSTRMSELPFACGQGQALPLQCFRY